MPQYQYVVLTNPVEGREDEYNEWYNNFHVKETCQTPGFKSGKRFKITPQGSSKAPLKHKYAVIYEIETDDIGAVFADLTRRAIAREFTKGPALDSSTTYSVLLEPMTEYKAK